MAPKSKTKDVEMAEPDASPEAGKSTKKKTQPKPKPKPKDKGTEKDTTADGEGETSGGKGKGRKKAEKKKGKGDKGEEKDSGEEDEENAEGDGGEDDPTQDKGARVVHQSEAQIAAAAKKAEKLSVFNKAEREKREAIISWNRINFLDKHITWENKHNTRDVVLGRATDLVESYKEIGLNPYADHTMVYAIVDPNKFHPDAVNRSTQKQDWPVFRLVGDPKRYTLQTVGGAHRRESTKLWHDDLVLQQDSINKEIEELQACQGDDADAIAAELIRAQETKRQIESDLEMVGWWGVVVLDRTKLSEETLFELSRNRPDPMYTETDTEKTTVLLKQFFSSRKDNPNYQSKDTKLAPILHKKANDDVLWAIAHNADPFATEGQIVGLAPLTRALDGHTGDFIAHIGGRSAQILPRLLNPEDITSNSASLLALLKKKKRTPEEEVELESKRTTALDQFYKAKRDHDLVKLLSDVVINQLDIMHSAMWAELDFSYGTSSPAYVRGMENYGAKLYATLCDALDSQEQAHQDVIKSLGKKERKMFLVVKEQLEMKIKILFDPGLPKGFMRLPVFTPKSFRGLVETFVPLAPSLIEICSWMVSGVAWFSAGHSEESASEPTSDETKRAKRA